MEHGIWNARQSPMFFFNNEQSRRGCSFELRGFMTVALRCLLLAACCLGIRRFMCIRIRRILRPETMLIDRCKL
jgi:hypothetical protein